MEYWNLLCFIHNTYDDGSYQIFHSADTIMDIMLLLSIL